MKYFKITIVKKDREHIDYCLKSENPGSALSQMMKHTAIGWDDVFSVFVSSLEIP